MSGGKVAIISNKIATMVDTEVSANSLKVWPNGEVQLGDGRKLHLEEGQLVTHEGKVLPLPARPKIAWKQGSDNPQTSAPLPKK